MSFGDQNTPLHLAALEGHVDTAALLIEHDADVNAMNTVDRTPLFYAVEGIHPEVAKLLIARGADVSAGPSSNITPLHVAVAKDSRKLVELLLASGAKIDVKSVYAVQPGTPLDWAERLGHEEIAELLRQHKAAQ
jgi:ankyrin repeat protein